MLFLFILHVRAVTLTSLLSPPPRVGLVVWGLYPSFRLGQLYGNNLVRARGILDDQRHGDVCGLFVGFNCCVCVITGRWGIAVQEWSIAWGSYWSWCCTWYWGWCRFKFVFSEETAVPNWNPDPSTLMAILVYIYIYIHQLASVRFQVLWVLNGVIARSTFCLPAGC